MNEPRLRSRRHLGKSLGANPWGKTCSSPPQNKNFCRLAQAVAFFLLRLGRQAPSPHPPAPDS